MNKRALAIKLASIKEKDMNEEEARQYCFDRLTDEYLKQSEEELMNEYIKLLKKGKA